MYRAKQHLAGDSRNVTGCKKVPGAVKAEIKQYMIMKQQTKEQLNLMPDMDTMLEEELEDEDEEMVAAQAGRAGASRTRQPINVASGSQPSVGLKKPKAKGPWIHISRLLLKL